MAALTERFGAAADFSYALAGLTRWQAWHSRRSNPQLDRQPGALGAGIQESHVCPSTTI